MTGHLALMAAQHFHLHGKGFSRLAVLGIVVALIVFFRAGKKGNGK